MAAYICGWYDRLTLEVLVAMAKGHKTGGRAKGTPNKIDGQVREMVLTALRDLGGKEYFATQAISNPNAFLKLIGKMLPLQTAGKTSETSTVSGNIRVIKRVIINPTAASKGADVSG